MNPWNKKSNKKQNREDMKIVNNKQAAGIKYRGIKRVDNNLSTFFSFVSGRALPLELIRMVHG